MSQADYKGFSIGFRGQQAPIPYYKSIMYENVALVLLYLSMFLPICGCRCNYNMPLKSNDFNFDWALYHKGYVSYLK